MAAVSSALRFDGAASPTGIGSTSSGGWASWMSVRSALAAGAPDGLGVSNHGVAKLARPAEVRTRTETSRSRNRREGGLIGRSTRLPAML